MDGLPNVSCWKIETSQCELLHDGKSQEDAGIAPDVVWYILRSTHPSLWHGTLSRSSEGIGCRK